MGLGGGKRLGGGLAAGVGNLGYCIASIKNSSTDMDNVDLRG